MSTENEKRINGETGLVVNPAQKAVLEASDRRAKIKQALSNGTAWFLEAGRLLYEACKNQDYLALGWENQREYFVGEFNISLSTAHNLMDIYEVFKDKAKDAAQAGYTRLVKILPLVRNASEEEKEDWLTMAKEYPVRAFEDAIKEAKKKTPSDGCDHEFKHLLICKKCGFRTFQE